MATAIFTFEAEEDLRQIATYIGQDNLAAAMAWFDATRATCDLLATQPALGQRIKTKRFGEVRCHSTGKYMIYYRQIAGGVEVLMVVHGARDQGALI